MSEITFDNRVAVVTGAGGGLGRTYALEFARRGARVVVNDLGGSVDGSGGSEMAADAVVAEIEASGGEAVANYDSVSTPDGGANIVQTTIDAFGQVDILVNNAGILRDTSFAKMTTEQIDAVLDVHLKGAFYVSQPAFAMMKERGYGRIINTSSPSGLFGNFGQVNYGAAKAGLMGMASVMAIEGAKYNIKVNTIAPVAKTRMTEDLLGPLADMVHPEQVTPLVVYLASETCTLTHQVFSVGGGRYARIFLGVNDGWFAGKDVVPTVEDIHANLDTIQNIDDYSVPLSNNEEMALLFKALEG
ncbi:MAG: SDR family oxidoreductase [Acidimicrobiia bacterium]|nr:SDR family oxidoreductase [Acidimicrobiia bacterium]MDH5421617.1 SDR family oxidoreductase [Acidimicrobiia bacterium]MDH5502968.1 SDR family oxidoreductase [Acidimicrobiia bacterium]